jgi:hypothetical protein
MEFQTVDIQYGSGFPNYKIAQLVNVLTASTSD